MKFLVFDTTTDFSTIGVVDNGKMLVEYNTAHNMDMSQRLLPNITSVLKDCRVEMSDLDGIGVSLGPGSFTGLRIGVVTAKTMAQALGIPVAGIVSLDVLAYAFDYLPDKIVCPIIKVRKGEVYYAFYRSTSDAFNRITDYAADNLEKVIQTARQFDKEVIFVGDALSANASALKDGLGDRMIPAPDWLCAPKADVLAKLTLEKFASGEELTPAAVMPFYIRKSTPEIRLEEKCSSENQQ